MKHSSFSVLGIIIAVVAAIAGATDHKPPKVQPAMEFAASEVHEDDKLAIAVEPYDTKEKESIFRIDYLAHGVMPIRLIVTNLGDKPISLKEARILFATAEKEKIQASEPEDVERLMTRKEREGSHIPMPAPLPKIHTKGKATNKDIEADFDTFEYGAVVVEPHTTRAGFLFYEVTGMKNPLQGAHMLIRKVLNSEGIEIYDFDIPFSKYLNSKSSQMD